MPPFYHHHSLTKTTTINNYLPHWTPSRLPTVTLNTQPPFLSVLRPKKTTSWDTVPTWMVSLESQKRSWISMIHLGLHFGSKKKSKFLENPRESSVIYRSFSNRHEALIWLFFAINGPSQHLPCSSEASQPLRPRMLSIRLISDLFSILMGVGSRVRKRPI